MKEVRAKKSLGQHFLNNLDITDRIAEALQYSGDVIEVGPGMGVLTQFLMKKKNINLKVAEIDTESIKYLKAHYPTTMTDETILGDFLQLDLTEMYPNKMAVIGNFPYNISSQIFFHILEHKNNVPEIVGMLQREVAKRITATPTGKEFGILSVLLQAYYHVEYLFEVGPENFNPPPKVQSAVIRLTRNDVMSLDCDEKLMKSVVKATFNHRRKTIRNTVGAMYPELRDMECQYFSLRPERLSVEDFVGLTNFIEKHRTNI